VEIAAIFKALLEYGVLGVLVCAQGYVIWRMGRKIEALYERDVEAREDRQMKVMRLASEVESALRGVEGALEEMYEAIARKRGGDDGR